MIIGTALLTSYACFCYIWCLKMHFFCVMLVATLAVATIMWFYSLHKFQPFVRLIFTIVRQQLKTLFTLEVILLFWLYEQPSSNWEVNLRVSFFAKDVVCSLKLVLASKYEFVEIWRTSTRTVKVFVASWSETALSLKYDRFAIKLLLPATAKDYADFYQTEQNCCFDGVVCYASILEP